MANFSREFSGRGTTARLEGDATQSFAGLAQTVKEIENIRFQTFQKNRAEFLKNADIDPAFVLSTSARESQVEAINNFNKKWGKRAQETNYNLSEQDRMNMQTERNLIEALKNEQLGQYELFRQHRDLVAKNPNRYDIDKFNEVTDSYMQSGKYDQSMPALKSIPFGSFIREQASKAKGEFDPVREIVGSREGIKTRNIQDIPKFIEDNLFVNDQATIGLLEDWEKEDASVKEKFLIDADRDNKISASEQKNAIVNWAKNRYYKDAEIRDYTWRNIGTGGSTAKGSTASQVKEGIAVPYKKYGNMEYNNSYEFDGSKVLRNVSTNGATGIFGDYEDQLASGNISGRLLLYNPDKDVMVFETVGSSQSADTGGSTLVEIPAKNITNVDDIPITINGAKGTVGELRARRQRQQERVVTPTSTTPASGKWDKFKR